VLFCLEGRQALPDWTQFHEQVVAPCTALPSDICALLAIGSQQSSPSCTPLWTCHKHDTQGTWADVVSRWATHSGQKTCCQQQDLPGGTSGVCVEVLETLKTLTCTASPTRLWCELRCITTANTLNSTTAAAIADKHDCSKCCDCTCCLGASVQDYAWLPHQASTASGNKLDITPARPATGNLPPCSFLR
jgi:hypothetical protein